MLGWLDNRVLTHVHVLCENECEVHDNVICELYRLMPLITCTRTHWPMYHAIQYKSSFLVTAERMFYKACDQTNEAMRTFTTITRRKYCL